MINKFYKTIHNKYSIFFRFLFFLRYLFLIFLTAIILFLFLPNLFNYENKAKIIKNYLAKTYDFEITDYEKVEFTSLPQPKIQFHNTIINIKSSKIQSNVKKLEIYPKLLSIYNFNNFQSKKIILKNSNINLDYKYLKILLKNIIVKNERLFFDNLNINILNNDKFLVKINNLKFSNYGYKRNFVEGKIFERKFKIKINEKLNNVNFKLLNSGIKIDIDLANQTNNIIKGFLKSKILNSNLKFNFEYDGEVLKVNNSFFRSKNISFKNESIITIKPFLDLNSNFEIEDFDIEMLNNIKINRLLMFKEYFKQINSKNEINFKSKKFSQNLVDTLYLKLDLAYGRLNFSKRFSISENFFQCQGDTNLLEEFPLIFFECLIFSENKKKFFKIFNQNLKEDNKNFNLVAKGNLNILNKKINFREISVDDNYKATKEDLAYFKGAFESILFEKSFIEIAKFRMEGQS